MRKIFTLFTMCMLAASAWAIDITFDATVDVGTGSSTAGEFTITKDGITLHEEQGVANGSHYRFYKNMKLTITSEIGNITGVVFTCVGANDGQYGPAGFTANVGNYSYEDHLGIWTGDNASIIFDATNFQVRATKIVVTVGGEVGLMAPNITPASGTFYAPIEVSMHCINDGAKIYYTLDGSNPTTASTEYTAPFTLSENTTVKAISALDGETSDVVTASYVFTDAPVFGLGDMFSAEDESDHVFTHDAIVIWQGGNNNNYLYLKDETGYGLIYGAVGQTYHIGDVIPAGFGGKKTTYKGEPELAAPLTGFQPAKDNVPLTPETITPTQVTHDYWAHYVLLKNVTINADTTNLTDANGNTCEMYNKTFNIELPSDLSKPHDVYGIVGVFSAYQVLPIGFDVAPTPPGPELPTDVASIEELYQLEKGKQGHFTTPLTAVYQNGSNLYVKDVEGTYSLVYGEVEGTFTNGDYINDAIATWSEYQGAKQMLPAVPSTFVPAGHADAVTPEEMPIEEISQDMVHTYYAFYGVKIRIDEESGNMYLVDETGEMQLFNKFKIEVPEINDEDTYDVEAFLAVYRGEMELYPTIIKVVGDEFLPEDVNHDGEVNIADVNCVIDYILKGASEYNCDANLDGEANIADVNAIIDYILKH